MVSIYHVLCGTPQFCDLSPCAPGILSHKAPLPYVPHLDISHTPVFPTVGHHNAYIHHVINSSGSLHHIIKVFWNFACILAVSLQSCLQSARMIRQLKVLFFLPMKLHKIWDFVKIFHHLRCGGVSCYMTRGINGSTSSIHHIMVTWSYPGSS